ncbi:hypothetical protein OPT61_g8609 [Boeremia exigua]|uniref:Uncharacterized protein n=1 Tax=Boeremia exigua TaxID=749465 RepID=A0ACC2HXI6_9PLEO|nr:hypothetical protein OPT61_g8609 [Boeremia exigua]
MADPAPIQSPKDEAMHASLARDATTAIDHSNASNDRAPRLPSHGSWHIQLVVHEPLLSLSSYDQRGGRSATIPQTNLTDRQSTVYAGPYLTAE